MVRKTNLSVLGIVISRLAKLEANILRIIRNYEIRESQAVKKRRKKD